MKNYTGAMQMYAKGLEAIEPYLYLSLVTEYEGRSINVATELFNAYINVFSGFELIQNVTEVGAEAFKACGEPLTVCLIKKGEVMSNVLLRAEFVSGEGELTAPVKTDSEGVATFYITNLTSKQSIQAVVVDDPSGKTLPNAAHFKQYRIASAIYSNAVWGYGLSDWLRGEAAVDKTALHTIYKLQNLTRPNPLRNYTWDDKIYRGCGVLVPCEFGELDRWLEPLWLEAQQSLS